MNTKNDVRSRFVEGDVVDYDREREWCGEGVAVVSRRRSGALVLADTFWDGGSETHILTAEEVETAVLRFNINDFRELDHKEHRESVPREHWQDIPSQHGLRRRRFVRIDAEPTWEQIHANARQDIVDALHEVATALSRVEGRRYWAAHLRELEAEGVKPW